MPAGRYAGRVTAWHGHSALARLPHGAGGREQSEQLANGRLPAGGFWQWPVGPDLVAVAAAILDLDDVPTLYQVSDDGISAAFGDTEDRRDTTQTGAKIISDAQERRAWFVRNPRFPCLEYSERF